MTKYYVKWQLNPFMTPKDPEKIVQGWLWMADMVKADVHAGKVKDFGVCCDGSGGYAIREEKNEQDLYTALLKWSPYCTFDVKPVLTVDEAIESIKKNVAAQAK